MKLVGDLISSLDRIKVHNASCEELHRRCRLLLMILEENTAHIDPDEVLEASQLMDSMLLTITKRLDDWGRLTILESFLRRTEMQVAIRSMIDDLRLTAEKLQLVTGPQFHLSSAEIAHLDIQDSLQLEGILRYIAGRPEELKMLTEGSFTPSDCHNFAMALQMDLRDNAKHPEERSKLSDALWKLTTWTNMAPPFANMDVGIRIDQEHIWKRDFTSVFSGNWSGHPVALTKLVAMDSSLRTRIALEEKVEVWRHLHHNHVKAVWGYTRLDGTTYIVGPRMKHWDLINYLQINSPTDHFHLILNLATGLDFLHKQTPPIFVGPITPRSIHVSGKGKACIADYGVLPTILQGSNITYHDVEGFISGSNISMASDRFLLDSSLDVRYFAPELLAKRSVDITSASDVYTFAMICLHILTGASPFLDIPEEKLINLIRSGKVPQRPQTDMSHRWLSGDIWELLVKCWSQDPATRPDISSVVVSLRLLHRARKDTSLAATLTSQQNEVSVVSVENNSTPSAPSHICYARSGEIISGSLTGLVAKLLSDTAGLASDPVSNAFFHTFRAFTTPDMLLDTLENVYQEKFSHATSVEARIAGCFDLLNFLEAWLRRERSYVPTHTITERMKKLVSFGFFSAAPTLAERVNSVVQMIDEWFGLWGSSSASSSITAVEPPGNKQFDLGGMSPRTVAYALTYAQSELYYDILPPDFVQWSQNFLSRSGRNGIAVFMDRTKQIGHWVTQMVLKTSDLRRRAEIVEFFIHTATGCLSLGNYSTMAAIVAPLRSFLIRRLALTWRCISAKARDALLDMDKILDPERNHSAYRKSYELVKGSHIPHLGVHLLDIKMLFALASATPPQDGQKTFVPFAKYQNLYRHIIQIIMQPSDHIFYQKTCDTNICVPLCDSLRLIVINEVSLKDLERRSTALLSLERRASESGLQKIERHLFGQDKRRSAEDVKARSSEDGADSDHEASLKQLPLSVKDLSRDIVKLQDHSVTSGGFCDVYLGEGVISGKLERVAMKMLRFFSSEQKVKKAFHKEVELWVRVRHPFVLPFYGVSEEYGRFFMISPWAEHGNALQYLQTYPTANRRKLLWQTSDALKYLHSGTEIPPIVHGDIKAENILISDSGDALLADFGLARLVDTVAAITATSTTVGGTARFMAPELLLPNTASGECESGSAAPRTSQSDVYAFACLILQIFTEERPFSRLALEPQVILAIVQGEKPSPRPPGHEAFLRGFDEDLWALANQCWAFEPGDRPKMKVVSIQLREAMYRIQRISLL